MGLPSAGLSELASGVSQLDSSRRLRRFIPHYKAWLAEKRDIARPALDFVFGNPQKMAEPEFVRILQQAAEPTTPGYFAYRVNEIEPRAKLAPLLQQRHGFPAVDPDDIFLTTGAFAGLSVALKMLVNPTDRIIAPTPGWFFYDRISPTQNIDWVAVSEPSNEDTTYAELCRRDIDAMCDAVTPQTTAIIFNNPHNPTGRLYQEPELRHFADRLLSMVTERNAPIYVICDDAYCDLVFDGAQFKSLALFYPYAITVYTFGKVLLSPSQRLGYLLLPHDMPGKELIREHVFDLLMETGYAIPNALMIEAVPKLMALRCNFPVESVQRRRDFVVKELTTMGYDIAEIPRGTFYLMVKVPNNPQSGRNEDELFCEELAARGVFVMPGSILGVPASFRICLTGTDEMFAASMDAFRETMIEWTSSK